MQALQGAFLLRTGQKEKGRSTIEDVVRKVRALPGPDNWTQALFTLERLARAARDAGEWDLAEWIAQQMLQHDPNYAGTHYALGLVAQHKGDAAASRKAFDLAKQYWSKADAGLPELKQLR